MHEDAAVPFSRKCRKRILDETLRHVERSRCLFTMIITAVRGETFSRECIFSQIAVTAARKNYSPYGENCYYLFFIYTNNIRPSTYTLVWGQTRRYSLWKKITEKFIVKYEI